MFLYNYVKVSFIGSLPSCLFYIRNRSYAFYIVCYVTGLPFLSSIMGTTIVGTNVYTSWWFCEIECLQKMLK